MTGYIIESAISDNGLLDSRMNFRPGPNLTVPFLLKNVDLEPTGGQFVSYLLRTRKN